jgi:transposase InsO family protein
VTPHAVQARLRQVFARHGMPERLRVDNGAPWGKRSDLPSALGLWLIGLGIEIIWNPPGRPQKNGVVERGQGTTRRWAEPEQCQSWAELQEHLDQVICFQRDVYPSLDGRSRSAVYPQLAAGGRPYDPSQEAAQWQLERVGRWLEQGVWRRRVDKSGKIYLFNWSYYAGERRAGQWVSVRWDGSTKEWVLLADEGQEVRRYVAEQITAERIGTLDVTHQKPSQRKAKEAKLAAGEARV